ncbi:MAG: relaxase/mobilization nuclease domain-containing protein [Verrucomicrobiota bacterium]
MRKWKLIVVISFIGGEKANVDYLTRNPTAQILKGSPQITKAVIESLPFKQRFCSGCISFQESISSKKAIEHIAEFENVAQAGLPENSLNYLWVQHSDKGRTELHFIVPQVNLITRSQITVYLDQRDRSLFNAFRDKINQEEGYTRPNAPESVVLTAIPKRTSVAKKELLQLLDTMISNGVSAGEIQNREGLVDFLEGQGWEVKRSKSGKFPKEYLGIKKPADSKFTRLRGAYFRESFTSVQALKDLANQPVLEPEPIPEAVTRLQPLLEARAKRQRARHEQSLRAAARLKKEENYENESIANPFSQSFGRATGFARSSNLRISRAVGILCKTLAPQESNGNRARIARICGAIDQCGQRMLQSLRSIRQGITGFATAIRQISLNPKFTLYRGFAKQSHDIGPSR